MTRKTNSLESKQKASKARSAAIFPYRRVVERKEPIVDKQVEKYQPAKVTFSGRNQADGLLFIGPTTKSQSQHRRN